MTKVAKKPSIKGVHLAGKVVRLKKKALAHGLDPEQHLFFCQTGFGCNPNSIGTAIFGVFSDGTSSRISRQDIECVVEGHSGFVRNEPAPPKVGMNGQALLDYLQVIPDLAQCTVRVEGTGPLVTAKLLTESEKKVIYLVCK